VGQPTGLSEIMFRFFESLVDPFPSDAPTRAPQTLVAFCLHHCRSSWLYLLLVGLLSAVIAIVEVSLFSYLGNIVDWLAEADRETFLENNTSTLIWMAVVMLILPMVIRWQAHRYLLGQSQSFFNNEFAGRIGTKVMQTSLSVREAVMKLIDVVVYVAVYFLSVLVLIAGIDWRLMLPFLLWLIFYLVAIFYFVPRLGDVSKLQADARALMTGRVIDSYTNILTVKLFSHSKRESAYARDAMDGFMTTVYKQMRLSAAFEICVDISGMVLLAVTLFTGIYLWMGELISAGAVAVSLAVILRMQGLSHWIMWEVAGLFENIGIVRDGMATLGQARTVNDKADASDLEVSRGAIAFRDVSFDYVSELPVIQQLNFDIQPGEKVGIVGRSGAGKTTLVNLLLRLYDIQQGSIEIDNQNLFTASKCAREYRLQPANCD